MNHKKTKCMRGTAWHASVGAGTVLSYMSWNGGNQSIGLRLVEELPVAAEPPRVNRGSGWISVPQYARVAYRSDVGPGLRNGDLGIRLVEVFDE